MAVLHQHLSRLPHGLALLTRKPRIDPEQAAEQSLAFACAGDASVNARTMAASVFFMMLLFLHAAFSW